MPRNFCLQMRTRLARLAAVADRPWLSPPATPWPSGRPTASAPTATAAMTTAAAARRAARGRRLRLLPAGAVLEPDLLRRRRREAPRSAMQPAPGRPYAFVLHGLWPQYERGWPQDCRSPDRGFVPRPGGRAACSTSCRASGWSSTSTASTAPAPGLGVDGYFDLARRLYEKVKIPPRFVGLTDPRTTVSPGELMQEFMAANPKLEPDMIVVQCGGAGNRLKEVRICFDKGGDFRACGRNENQAGCAAPTACTCHPCASAPASGAIRAAGEQASGEQGTSAASRHAARPEGRAAAVVVGQTRQ